MKRTLTIFSMLLFLGLSTQAHALLDGSRITSVTKIDDDACAITIDADDSLVADILDADQLLVDGNLLADLGELIDRLLDLDLDSADDILIASTAFETLTGLTADLHIDNDDCSTLDVGSVLKIQVPGLLGGTDILDVVTLPEGFGDLTALVIDEDGDLDLVDLVHEVLQILGLETAGSIGGGEGNVGGNPPAGGEDSGSGAEDGGPVIGELPGDAASGGCSLGAAVPAAGLELMAWVGAAAALIASRKRN